MNNFSTLVDDKKYSKEIQESTHKLFELCNSIVASSLQQTTWLRKNYAVKLTPSINQAPAAPQMNPTTNGVNSNSSASLSTLNSTTANQSAQPPSSNNSAVVVVGAGPGVGGTILVQGDITSVSNASNVSSSSGFVGSNSNVSVSINSENKFQSNNSSRYYIENGGSLI